MAFKDIEPVRCHVYSVSLAQSNNSDDRIDDAICDAVARLSTQNVNPHFVAYPLDIT